MFFFSGLIVCEEKYLFIYSVQGKIIKYIQTNNIERTSKSTYTHGNFNRHLNRFLNNYLPVSIYLNLLINGLIQTPIKITMSIGTFVCLLYVICLCFQGELLVILCSNGQESNLTPFSIIPLVKTSSYSGFIMICVSEPLFPAALYARPVQYYRRNEGIILPK